MIQSLLTCLSSESRGSVEVVKMKSIEKVPRERVERLDTAFELESTGRRLSVPYGALIDERKDRRRDAG